MDEMGHKLLRMVDELKIRRLAVDGLAGLADTLAFSERGYRFLGRLLAELKTRGVTSIFTVDPAALAVAANTPLAEGVVGWFDNAFVFNHHSMVTGTQASAFSPSRRFVEVMPRGRLLMCNYPCSMQARIRATE